MDGSSSGFLPSNPTPFSLNLLQFSPNTEHFAIWIQETWQQQDTKFVAVPVES
jgi:hypothetical protein